MKILLSPPQALNLAHFAAAGLILKLKHDHILSANQTVSEFISAKLQPSSSQLSYSRTAGGKIGNRLTSCKSFSGRVLELVTDLQAIVDPSVTKSSSTTAYPATTVDEEKGSEGQVEDEGREHDLCDQAEFSDDQVDDDGWESGWRRRRSQ